MSKDHVFAEIDVPFNLWYVIRRNDQGPYVSKDEYGETKEDLIAMLEAPNGGIIAETISYTDPVVGFARFVHELLEFIEQDEGVMGMREISVGGSNVVRVPLDTDDATIAALKNANPVRFSEFVYTGNSSNGQNSGNYEDVERWLLNAGMTLIEDDLSLLLYELHEETGICTLDHRGKRLRYHCQRRQGEGHGDFGYTWRVEYRLIEVQDL